MRLRHLLRLRTLATITTINSANYPENFLKYRSYVFFSVTALKIRVESTLEFFVGIGKHVQYIHTWRTPPCALSIFHRLAAPPDPKRGM